MQIRVYLISILFFLVISNAQSQESWKMVKDEAGIKVYTQFEPGSRYKSFKAEMQVYCKIEDILYILKHSDSLNTWVVNCKGVKLLKTENHDQYFYIETSLPMPFQSRDMVYHFQYQEISRNQYRVNVNGKPDYIQHINGIVRMEKADGFWLLTSVDTDKINVTYQMHVEPGGIIPAWLVNPFIKNVPFSTFEELRKIVQKKIPNN